MRQPLSLFLALLGGCFAFPSPECFVNSDCDPGFSCGAVDSVPACIQTCDNGVLDVDFLEDCDASAPNGHATFCDETCQFVAGGGCGDGVDEPGAFCLQDAAVLELDAREALVADFDQDGDQDLIYLFDAEAPQLKVLLNDGAGNFSSATQGLLVDGAPRQLADLNNDGLLDILLLGDNKVRVVLQGPQGELIPAGQASASGILDNTKQRAGELADFNNDGALDLLSATNQGFSVFFGDGAGGLSAPSVISGATRGAGFNLVQDWDGDGDLDWLAFQELSPQSQALILFENQGGVLLAGPTLAVLDFNEDGLLGSNKLDAQDWDSDGDPDLMLGALNGSLLLLRNDTGTFTTEELLPGPSQISNGVVGDFNGDGFPDIALTLGLDVSTFQGGFSLLENDGAGNFTEVLARNVDGSLFIRSQDLNSDGLDDLLFLGFSSIDLALLAPDFAPQAIDGGKLEDTYADFNGDGFLDLVGFLGELTVKNGGAD